MKCLVTGAGGFVGARLVCVLNSMGIETILLSKRKLCFNNEIILCDLSKDDINVKKLEGVDTVFHLASLYDMKNKDKMYRVNVEGTRRLLRVCEQSGVKKFIYFSSVKAMCEVNEFELDESFTPTPNTEYGRQKLIAEEIVMDSKLNSVIIRPTPIYGRGCRGSIMRLAFFIKKSPIIPKLRINNRRSMVYLDDVVNFAIKCAKNSINKDLFILTDGFLYSTSDIVNIISNTIDKKKNKRIVDIPFTELFREILKIYWPYGYNALFLSSFYSNKKACEILGFNPQNTLYNRADEIFGELI